MDDTSLFTAVNSFQVDLSGRFWVYDRPTNTIFLFDADGVFLRRVGRAGGGPGEFYSNNGMVALADGGMAALDSRNGRISFFDATGAFTRSWVVSTGFSTTNGLKGDGSGALFLVRPVTPPRDGEILGRMGLVRPSEDGSLSDSLIPPELPVPREGYVAERKESGGGVSRSATSVPNGAQYFWAWAPDGYFVVAHGGKYEITLAPTGRKPITIHREYDPVPVTGEELEELKASITYGMRRTLPSWTWSGPDLPKVKAPLTGLTVARDGRIWARVAVPSERIPDDEVTPSRDDRAPSNHFRSPTVYEVFEPDGRFFARVEFPPRVRLVEAEGEIVWALGSDADGLPAVLRYRMTSLVLEELQTGAPEELVFELRIPSVIP
jgi:hypothetical protein